MNKEEKINEYFNALFSKRYQKYNLLFKNHYLHRGAN